MVSVLYSLTSVMEEEKLTDDRRRSCLWSGVVLPSRIVTALSLCSDIVGRDVSIDALRRIDPMELRRLRFKTIPGALEIFMVLLVVIVDVTNSPGHVFVVVRVLASKRAFLAKNTFAWPWKKIFHPIRHPSENVFNKNA